MKNTKEIFQKVAAKYGARAGCVEAQEMAVKEAILATVKMLKVRDPDFNNFSERLVREYFGI